MSGGAVVQRMVSPAEVDATFPVMRQLRPDYDEASYRAAIARLRATGFELAAVVDRGAVVAVAGYRYGESLAWGRYCYVDDLVTSDAVRSRGHGKHLLDWLVAEARARGCRELHLDSGVQRFAAHRFYLRERMEIRSHHFAIPL